MDVADYRWYHKASALLVIVFCIEVGLVLMAAPWSPFWDSNAFLSLTPAWYRFWHNDYARGAVTGIGALNIYVAFAEVHRLRRFAKE